MLIAKGALCIAIATSVGQRGPVPFPKTPSFQRPVDFISWYDAAVKRGATDDAYGRYKKFMPGLVGSDIDPGDWVRFSGMLTGEGWDDGPIPWKPAEHRDWEISHGLTADVLRQFVAAAAKKHLAAPSGLSPRIENKRNLFSNIPLSHAKYMDQCARGVLEAAWRAEDGKASAAALLKAFSTNLRAVRQLEQGLFFVEHTAAHDIRRVTYEHIAWAFAHEVLAGKDAKKLRATLRKLDDDPVDIRRALRGEAAALLDALQYVFGPYRGGGSSKLNANRFREVTGVTMGANRMAIGARLTTDPAGTARAIADMFKAFDRAMAPPYDTAHEVDIQRAGNEAVRLNQITRAMLLQHLWLSAYQSAMRAETHRRANRVLVELMVYKDKKGKWPKKLSSLGSKTMRKIGEDPYARKGFVYIRTDDGPLLYSVGRDGKDDRGTHADDWGYSRPDGDFVFWPIPDGSKLIAAVKLGDAEEEQTTRIADIGDKLVDKEVTVVAMVAQVSSRPSRKYGRRYSVVLGQGGDKIELTYYEDLARKLSAKQEIEAGLTVRVIGIVEKTKNGFRLRLRDADNLVVERPGG